MVRPRFVWGKGDTTLLPEMVKTVEAGKFAWVGGGRNVTDTAHVDNVVEGLLLGAEKGRPGEAYFVTDGEPVVFREFVTEMLRTQGVEPPDRSLPAWTAAPLARVCELAWKLPLPRRAADDQVPLLGPHPGVHDRHLARPASELGYEPVVSHEQGPGGAARRPSAAGAVALELGDHQLRVQGGDQVLQGLGAGFEHLDHALGRDLAGEAVHDDADLLADQVFEGALVAQGVVDGEADLLVVAAGAEAADRLDDLHVGGRVAAAVGAQHLELLEPVEHLLGDAVALADLGGAGPGALARQRPVEDAVLELDQGAGALGVLVEHRLDRPQRHEALLLQLLDQLDPVDELGRVVGHVAAGLDRLRQQALAQVVLDRRRRHAGGLRQLAHAQQLRVSVARAHARKVVAESEPGPAAAPDSTIAAISSSE